MTHALVTVFCPLPPDRLTAAEREIDRLALLSGAAGDGMNLGALQGADGAGVHFASVHAIRSPSDGRAYLLIEISADGSDYDAVRRLVAAYGPALKRVLVLSSEWRDGGDTIEFLLDRRCPSGAGWFDSPGLGFVGAPGMTVGRIRDDHELAKKTSELVGGLLPGGSHLERLHVIRAEIARSPMADALQTPDASKVWAPASVLSLAAPLVLSFVSTFLWPLLLLSVAAAAAAAVAELILQPHGHAILERAAHSGVETLGRALIASAVVAAILLGFAYSALVAAERTDATDDRAPEHAINAEMFGRENRCRQNHMISVTTRKAGPLRAFTLRLVFWLIGRLLGRTSPPGYLGTIGSIHFARWVNPRGSRDLIFLSNYDGSWESYLEDFITRAHEGLTAVWSNSVGFPRSRNLFQNGATDSERFKRFARRSMVPTRFWYSAYPALTMGAIRSNALIRRGLAAAMTEDDAARWFALFGSAPRPSAKLVSSEIQSIVFGGLGFMPFARCLIHERLPADRAQAAAWLRELRPHIAYNDGRRLRHDAVITLALGPKGLSALGLGDDALASFPFAFVAGMTGGGRTHILGDDPSRFEWGRERVDAAVIVYARSEEAADDLCRHLAQVAYSVGVAAPREIPLRPVGGEGETAREPFGFADGISQPVIRGTYKGLRNADPIHLVEPGEFILGYPDGRGNMPPGPTLDAIHDPGGMLSTDDGSPGFDRTGVVSERRIGDNGTYLVIRELEQHVEGFRRYCEEEASRLAYDVRLPAPYVVNADFIGAKLVGRWPDGSSLVRYPYQSRSDERREGITHGLQRPTTLPEEGREPIEKPPSIDEDDGDNDFVFGAEDPEALRCPFGAHIRRANPRDSLSPGAADEIGISNRHRIIRVGRSLASRDGILFMCLNGDIERQFEFVQQSWLGNPSFHGLSCEADPLLGGVEGACGYTVPTRSGPIALSPLARYVRTCGGGYFFVPGKRLIDFLSARS